MAQINVIGTITGTTGYDVHTRQLVNALNKVAEVRLTAQIREQEVLNLNDEELVMLKRKPTNDEINLIITNPLLWRVNLGKRNWVYLIWEGDRLPKHIEEECNNERIEKIIVPSKHTLNVVPESARHKTVLIPHGVNLDIFKPEKKPEKFTFLANKGFRHLEDRGGIQYLLKAYLEEFKKEDNVNLIIKINPAYGVPNFEELLKDPFFPQECTAPLNIDVGSYKYEDLVNLYNKAHVFISPTRAESFNLPCLEALACGLPVLTTKYGGQTDYVNEKNGWIIDGHLESIKHEILYEGIKWLTPDIEMLKKTMRQAVIDYESKVEEAIKSAQGLTWSNTADKIVNLI